MFKIKIPCRCRNEFKGEGGGAGSVQAHFSAGLMERKGDRLMRIKKIILLVIY